MLIARPHWLAWAAAAVAGSAMGGYILTRALPGGFLGDHHDVGNWHCPHARDLLTSHREAPDRLTAALLEQETVTGDQVRALVQAPSAVPLPAGIPVSLPAGPTASRGHTHRAPPPPAASPLE